MLSVLKKGEPLADDLKLARLRQFLLDIMDAQGEGTVNFKRVRPLMWHPCSSLLGLPRSGCRRPQRPKHVILCNCFEKRNAVVAPRTCPVNTHGAEDLPAGAGAGGGAPRQAAAPDDAARGPTGLGPAARQRRLRHWQRAEQRGPRQRGLQHGARQPDERAGAGAGAAALLRELAHGLRVLAARRLRPGRRGRDPLAVQVTVCFMVCCPGPDRCWCASLHRVFRLLSAALM